MTEQEVQEMFINGLSNPADEIFDCIDYIRSFNEAGILSMNKGLVITMGDGSQFQLTIVKSR